MVPGSRYQLSCVFSPCVHLYWLLCDLLLSVEQRFYFIIYLFMYLFYLSKEFQLLNVLSNLLCGFIEIGFSVDSDTYKSNIAHI